MDSHETDSQSSLRNTNAVTTKQSASELTIDAASCAILNSSANTNINEYKGNDVNTVQPANRDHNVPDNSTQSHHSMHQSKVPHTTATTATATIRSTSMTSDIAPFASTSEQAAITNAITTTITATTTASDISSTTSLLSSSSTCTSMSATSTATSLAVRKSKQRKSDSSSSSPAMSPSYIQNKQYRTNTPRNVDLIDNVMHSNDNKENVPGIHAQYGTPSEQQQHRLDSPKFALQQNSPNTPLSSYKSPPSTHSSPMYTAHEPRSDCNIFTYSPLITEPFKNSTYFHFPDVDTPSPIGLATSQDASRAHLQLSSTLNNNNLIITSDDKKSNQSTLINNNNNNNYNRSNHSSHNIQIVASDECCSTTTPKARAKEAAVRRARLKSISLDSDGARLVEENLCIPVEELMERALKQHTNKTSFDEDSTPFHSPANHTSDEHRAHTKCLSKNYNHLVLDLSIKDDSLPNIDYQSSPSASDTKDERFQFNLSKSKSTTPKTPTLTQTRQKAISLDSDPNGSGGASVMNASHDLDVHHHASGGGGGGVGGVGTGMRTKPHLLPSFLCVESNASMSVPTTPRRQQIVKSALSKFSGPPGGSINNCGIGKGVTGNRKTGFASSAEYFASKKAADRKSEKLQLNPENEPILEGSVLDYYDDVYAIEHDVTSSFETSTDDVDCDIICGSANSLISHCDGGSGGGGGGGGGGDSGSGLGNSGMNNNLSSLSAGNYLGLGGNSNVMGLSLSNYSLSNFQGSHCSLARSNHNIYGMTSPANPCSQNVPMMAGAATAKSFSAASMQSQRQTSATGAGSSGGGGVGATVSSSSSTSAIGTRSVFCSKKNLLQRRGSNTSLTLNIVGGASGGCGGGGGGGAGGVPIATTQTTLNRFNSHNSLNVMSTPFETQRANNTISTTKKGLLERRNSNASLTLQLECRSNIQKRALSTSNCYLRGSDLSLSSSNNFESHLMEDQHRVCTMCGGGGIIKKNAKRSTSASAYNSDTNRYRSQEQAHQQSGSYAHGTDATMIAHQKSSHQMDYVEMSSSGCGGGGGGGGIGGSSGSTNSSRLKSNRSGRRKFFSSENLNIHNTFSLSQPPIKTSSVVDLNQSNSEMDDVYDDDQNTLCPCSSSVIRNISTKPLSPQTTSEDFKIYLANIQILQNASNVLTDNKLTTLTNVFNRSYGRTTNAATTQDGVNVDDADDKPCTACESCTLCKTCKICLTKCRCEQNCLLTNLHQEFWDLPTNYQEKPLVFGSQVKNRYKTILPNEHSRVILDAELESSATDPKEQQPISDLYINANYIKGPDYTQNSYIATQGPMSNTIYDFWLMVYQNYSRHLKSNKSNVDALPFQQKIAMLTDIIENDESKCAIYFPQNVGKFLCFLSNDERRQKDNQQSQAHLDAYIAEHEHEWFDLAQPNEIHTEIVIGNRLPSALNFNFFAVKTVDCLNKGGYTIRKFHCLYHTCKVLDKRCKSDTDAIPAAAAAAAEADAESFERKVHTFVVYHYWFPHWPDHRSPENIDVVLDMCINLIDSDCEQELQNAHSHDLLRAAHSIGDTDNAGDGADVNASAAKSVGRHSMDLSHSQPLMLNHVPFNGPTPIIHCSAGIGRTGCVAAILNGLRQLRLSYLSSSTSSSLNASDSTIKHASVDILGIVSNLRLQRGGMVQNSEQYELIHRALCLYHQRYLSK